MRKSWFFSFSKRYAWIPQDRPDESVLNTGGFLTPNGLISLYIEGSLNCRVPCLCFFFSPTKIVFFSMEGFFPINIILGNFSNVKLLWLWNLTSKSCCILFVTCKIPDFDGCHVALPFRPAYWIFNSNTGAFLAWCSLFMSNPYPPWMVYYIYFLLVYHKNQPTGRNILHRLIFPRIQVQKKLGAGCFGEVLEKTWFLEAYVEIWRLIR